MVNIQMENSCWTRQLVHFSQNCILFSGVGLRVWNCKQSVIAGIGVLFKSFVRKIGTRWTSPKMLNEPINVGKFPVYKLKIPLKEV